MNDETVTTRPAVSELVKHSPATTFVSSGRATLGDRIAYSSSARKPPCRLRNYIHYERNQHADDDDVKTSGGTAVFVHVFTPAPRGTGEQGRNHRNTIEGMTRRGLLPEVEIIFT